MEEKKELEKHTSTSWPPLQETLSLSLLLDISSLSSSLSS
jgi:hypothetical protein